MPKVDLETAIQRWYALYTRKQTKERESKEEKKEEKMS